MKGYEFLRSGVVCLLVLAGCASTGGKEAVPDMSAVTADVHEQALRNQIEAELQRARGETGRRAPRILFSKPYYYKEYWEYPETESVFSTDFTEKESRSVPMTAEVEIEKVRYATRVTRKRDSAREDDNFLRSTGIEQSSYELRHGEWRRIGSLFMAERTEEQVNGEWKQIEEVKKVVSFEEAEPKRWFDRLKFWR